MMRALFILLFSASIFNLSQANILRTPLPKPDESFTLIYIQNEAKCSYLVTINTSCYSSILARDHISIAFGDASGNQIYAEGLGEPQTGRFGPCSSNTYEINGTCAKNICYAYIYRTGPDDWKPESVEIDGGKSNPVTFYYNSTSVPNNLWYGFNLCNYPFSPSPPPSSPPPPPPRFPPFPQNSPPPPSPPPPSRSPPPPSRRPPPPPSPPPPSPPPPPPSPPPPPPHSPPPPSPPPPSPPPPPPPSSARRYTWACFVAIIGLVFNALISLH
ncbi:embryo-specific protein ATS3A-like [Ziziphus jujuba]|uniref:Embryo-specific protein ATS3A-like n=1 Tax=Ziziphus jujuba TaxID=326968 RepID=A0A6P3ZI80_ZIZJJ|nr:embryo-specific protein ATS3A-like [Ziziphus jujuba]